MTDDEGKAAYTREDLEKIGAKWMDRIRMSEKREESWRKDAAAAEKAYLADGESDSDGDVPEFNILHSNVETIVPSIYNSTPVPDIRPRHGNKDDLGKFVSEIYERAISVQIDDSRLDAEIEKSAQDAFMAGRGIVRLKFDADLVDAEPMLDPMTGELIQGPQTVQNERVEFEVVSWADYRQGPAKRWKDVPWVAYRHFLTHEDMERVEDDELKGLYAEESPATETTADKDVPVWEIWCKDSKRVYFIAGDTSKVLRMQDDPLNLKGYFPQAEPVQPITATNSLTPVCPFTIYKRLAEELEISTRRINSITKALKLRGFYAGNGGDLTALAEAEDNTLIPLPDMEGMVAAGGDLTKAISWWPLDMAIAVLQQLYVQREQTKQAIYEITGISDIIRGQGAASETATAQQIKTQWGSLRIKKMQRAIERQVRDIFVICADIISQHFTPETLQKLTGLQIPPEAMELLQKPLDHYRIDIESDSTVRADLTRGRQEMSEFLNGTASFFSTMAPIGQAAPGAAGELIEIYASFARQFSLGKSAEDALDRLVELAKEAAKNPPPNPEAEAMKADMELKSQDMQQRFALDSQKMQLDVQKAQLDVQLKQADLQLKERELGLSEAVETTKAAKAMFDAEMQDEELALEKEQARAVKIGNDNG